MAKTTLSVKVNSKFAKKVRRFCDRHALQVGRFAEISLEDAMEDYFFGLKAQRILSAHQGELLSHRELFKKH